MATKSFSIRHPLATSYVPHKLSLIVYGGQVELKTEHCETTGSSQQRRPVGQARSFAIRVRVAFLDAPERQIADVFRQEPQNGLAVFLKESILAAVAAMRTPPNRISAVR